VYGFGEHKTPKLFVSACDKFVCTENLVHLEELELQADSVAEPRDHNQVQKAGGNTHLASRLRKEVETTSDDDGWARLYNVGHLSQNNTLISILAPTDIISSAVSSLPHLCSILFAIPLERACPWKFVYVISVGDPTGFLNKCEPISIVQNCLRYD
jgi:hypothetical protein